jgi:hypothetical protein
LCPSRHFSFQKKLLIKKNIYFVRVSLLSLSLCVCVCLC